MNTVSQLIHSRKEVNVALELRINHMSSVAQVFQTDLIFISLCKKEAMQLSG